VDEIAAAIFPGKITGPSRVTVILGVLRGQCHARSEDGRWYPAS
jgi:hypothetical protein